MIILKLAAALPQQLQLRLPKLGQQVDFIGRIGGDSVADIILSELSASLIVSM